MPPKFGRQRKLVTLASNKMNNTLSKKTTRATRLDFRRAKHPCHAHTKRYIQHERRVQIDA